MGRALIVVHAVVVAVRAVPTALKTILSVEAARLHVIVVVLDAHATVSARTVVVQDAEVL